MAMKISNFKLLAVLKISIQNVEIIYKIRDNYSVFNLINKGYLLTWNNTSL